MSAPDHSCPPPAAVLADYTRIVKALAGELAVQVTWADLGPDVSGDFNGFERTVIINSAAPLETQYWLVHQAWTTCVFGEDAVPAAQRVRPALRVVR